MKIGRNDLCYCGSGKKYKKCCLNIDNDNNKIILSGSERYNILYNLEHIKKYNNIRNYYQGIIYEMVQYIRNEYNYDLDSTFYSDLSYLNDKDIKKYKIRISDFKDQLIYYGMFIFKTSINRSVTEIFLESNMYQNVKERKFLEALKNSYIGLFKINNIDSNKGYVYLEDVITGRTFKIIDVSLSDSLNDIEKVLLFAILVEVDNICFNWCSFGVLNDDKGILKYIEKVKARDVSNMAKILYLNNISVKNGLCCDFKF